MGSGPPSPATLVVRVRRQLLASCMTCPLCRKLLRDATTISECLHTFCRKCIFDKLTDEEADCCPICSTDLGCVPVEKLRPDHNLQDVRNKIFPLKRKRVDAPEVPYITLPVRRKERSLSSLVVSTPRMAMQSSLTGRRTKAARRAAVSRGTSPATNIPKEANNFDDQDHKMTSSPIASVKMIRSKKQSNLDAEASNQASNEDGSEPFLDKAELWKRLHCLVEAANNSSSPQRLKVKEEQSNDADIDVNIPKPKIRKHVNKFKTQEAKNGSISTPGSSKAKKLHQPIRRRPEIATSAKALLNAASKPHDRKTTPIWFSLVPSANQEGGSQLPRLSASYLRIKDGNLPISSIQKYIMMRLDLASEDEVEIMCLGQPTSPTMTLHSLVDLWFRNESTQRTHAYVGSSAKNFVMVLAYRRRVLAS